MRRRTRIASILVALTLLAAVLVFGQWSGLMAVEHHRGVFAPVWDADGRHVYFVEREASGVVLGFGYEMISPPALTVVMQDRIALRRLERSSGRIETLRQWDDSPAVGRWVRRYHGAILTSFSASLDATPAGIHYRMRMDIHKPGLAESWGLTGDWIEGAAQAAAWRPGPPGLRGTPDHALVNGREVLALPGREGFPAAIVEVTAEGTVTSLVNTPAFADLYAQGIPPQLIAERSQRAGIERRRELARVRAESIAGFEAEGMTRIEAELAAIDHMEDLGHYPKSPRLFASIVERAPDDLPTFTIDPMEFRVGLLSDILKAIESPGTEVHKHIGRYVRHRDYDNSERINAWLEQGHDQFVVAHENRLYLIELRYRRD
ncbi:MAG: hypothetical protein RBT51_13305 [Ectothiorhodospiraceae bacterium]|jgi:hypothetical protein|nr:hypothetical protein [Ectothiorhodospiraceae bacterium]